MSSRFWMSHPNTASFGRIRPLRTDIAYEQVRGSVSCAFHLKSRRSRYPRQDRERLPRKCLRGFGCRIQIPRASDELDPFARTLPTNRLEGPSVAHSIEGLEVRGTRDGTAKTTNRVSSRFWMSHPLARDRQGVAA